MIDARQCSNGVCRLGNRTSNNEIVRTLTNCIKGRNDTFLIATATAPAGRIPGVTRQKPSPCLTRKLYAWLYEFSPQRRRERKENLFLVRTMRVNRCPVNTCFKIAECISEIRSSPDDFIEAFDNFREIFRRSTVEAGADALHR